MTKRPADLFDREQEWADLDGFATSSAPGLQLGIVSGRRRQGKSYLLRRLVAAHGGLYGLALEEERRPALQRFGRDVAGALGVPGELRFTDWTEALRTAIGIGTPGSGRLVVLDEFSYLLRGAPELPSAIQAVYDEARSDPKATPATLILCGSAFSVMSELLSGAHPLRGRARLDLMVAPFDFRAARLFWGVEDLEVALRLHAILGGTPGYRDLTHPAPQTMTELDEWLGAHVLNPAHALFGETDYLLREDPRITDRALYQSVLAAISAGDTTPAAIAGSLGRDARGLWHALEVLRTAGFVTRSEDLLVQRKPAYAVADPIVRFAMLVVRPRQVMYEDRRAAAAWAASQDAFSARILGPHFEDLARQWTRRFASPATLGGEVSIVGQATINDPAGRARHEVDVLALAEGDAQHAKRVRIRALGEAKSRNRSLGGTELARLERIRTVLGERGHDVSQARLLLFSRTGFADSLRAAADARDDVELVDLDRLYLGE